MTKPVEAVGFFVLLLTQAERRELLSDRREIPPRRESTVPFSHR
jgi:hypothetical protein